MIIDVLPVFPAKSTDSYLNIPSVISAAEVSDADAIHPGYGFLSESAYFAEVCESSRVKFVGPSSESIRLMGNKARARCEMDRLGLPVLPGSSDAIDTEKEAVASAEAIGYPVIIKAVAGGGGRGIGWPRDTRRRGEVLPVKPDRSPAQGIHHPRDHNGRRCR